MAQPRGVAPAEADGFLPVMTVSADIRPGRALDDQLFVSSPAELSDLASHILGAMPLWLHASLLSSDQNFPIN